MTNILTKFDHRIDRPEPHIVSLLAQIDGIRGELKSGLPISIEAITSLRRSTIVTSTGASTRIEGSSLSNDEVEKIMHGLATIKFADRDTQEVQGYLETLQNVFDGYVSLPLRESIILSLHGELLKYAHKDEFHRGGYKQKENAVGVVDPTGKVVQIMFQTTPAYLTPKEMMELVEWTANALEKNRFHHLLIIANFVIELLKIHPFEDGNGRLSRVLTNLLLLRSGYMFIQYVSHEQIIERRKDEYYLALRKSQETFQTDRETIAPWLNFFLSVVREQGTQATEILAQGTSEEHLSPRQGEVWDYMMGKDEVSPSVIVSDTHIPLATVRQALNRLVELGKIKRVGIGRTTRYRKI